MPSQSESPCSESLLDSIPQLHVWALVDNSNDMTVVTWESCDTFAIYMICHINRFNICMENNINTCHHSLWTQGVKTGMHLWSVWAFLGRKAPLGSRWCYGATLSSRSSSPNSHNEVLTLLTAPPSKPDPPCPQLLQGKGVIFICQTIIQV